MERKVAALIHFKEGVDIERVKAWIAALEDKGVIEGWRVDSYNPDHGEPVWYIP